MDEDIGHIQRRAYGNAFFEFLGEAAATIAGLVFFVALSRYLGKVEVGRYTFVQSITMFVHLGLDLGTTGVALRSWSRTSDRRQVGREFGALFAFKTAVVLPLAAGALTWSFLFERQLVPILVAAIAIAFLDGLLDLLCATYQAENEFWTSNLIRLQDRMLVFGAGAIGALASRSLLITFGSMLIAKVGLAAYLARAHRDRMLWPERAAFSFRATLRIARESHGLFLQSVGGLVFAKMDVFLIRGMLGNIPLGIYGVSYRLLEQTAILPSLLTRAFYPSLVRAVAANDGRGQALYNQFNKIMLVSGTYVSLGAYLAAEPAIELLVGATYAESIPVFRVLAGSLFLKFAFLPAYSFLIASNRERASLIGFAMALPLNIALNLWLIPQLGIAGSAWSTVVAELLLALWCVRAVPLEYRVFPAVVCTTFAACSLALTLATDFHWLVNVCVMTVSFATVVLTTRLTSIREMRALFRRQPAVA